MLRQHQPQTFPQSVEIDAKGWVFDPSTGEILGARADLYAYAASQPTPVVRFQADEPEPEVGSEGSSRPHGTTSPHLVVGQGKTAEFCGFRPVKALAQDPERRGRQLRSAHRTLVRDIHKSVGLCGVGVASATQVENGGAEDSYGHLRVAVGKETRPHMAGVLHCASPWSCPVCSPRIAAKRALTLKPQIERQTDRGARHFLVTLTIRHQRGDDLGEMLAGLQRIWHRVTQARAWQRRKGRIDWVRGLDVTHSNGNGWHPHAHVFLTVRPDAGGENDDAGEVADFLVSRWLEQARKAGFEADAAAQDAQETEDSQRAAVYACTAAGLSDPGAVAWEAVASAKKSGKSSRTPFDILASAALGDRRDVKLWQEYVEATKGKKQVNTSSGYDLSEEAQDQAEEEAEHEKEGEADGDADEPATYELARLDARALWHADQSGDLDRLYERLRKARLPDMCEIVRDWAREQSAEGLILVEHVPRPILD